MKGNHLIEKGNSITKEAWKVVKKYTIERENQRLDELEEAVSNGNYISDLNEIWAAIPTGQIQTLFLEESLFQSAQIKENSLSLVGDEIRENRDVVDDIYDEIIEANMNHGGEIVFVPDGALTKHNGFAAITRY
jgi:stalled ribosome rescue protein Dom34